MSGTVVVILTVAVLFLAVSTLRPCRGRSTCSRDAEQRDECPAVLELARGIAFGVQAHAAGHSRYSDTRTRGSDQCNFWSFWDLVSRGWRLAVRSMNALLLALK